MKIIKLHIQAVLYLIGQIILPVYATQNQIEVVLLAKIRGDVEIELNSRTRWMIFQDKIRKCRESIKIFIGLKSFTLLTLIVKRSQYFIPKNFLYKYFSKNDISVRKHLNHRQRKSYCYFTGTVEEDPQSIVSLNLCKRNGIDGIIDSPTVTFSIKTIITKSRLQYRLYLQRELENDRQSIRDLNLTDLFKPLPFYNNMMEGEQHNSHKMNIHKRAAHTGKPSGSSSDLEYYYIEMYVILDHSFYTANERSLAKSVESGFAIINFAAALYSALNVYLVVVGIEIWNNRDRITYTYKTSQEKTFVDPSLLLGELSAYRMREVSPATHNDNIQLFTNKLFANGILGRSSVGRICSDEFSSGVNYYNPAQYTQAANTMTHELGHTLDFDHIVARARQTERTDCKCEINGTFSFEYCIMFRAASR